MIVMKFGGSSVQDAKMFKEVLKIVSSRIEKKPIVVLSAVKGTTDCLLNSIKEALENNFESFNLIRNNHLQILKNLEIDEHVLDDEFSELKKTLEVISKTKETSLKLSDYVSFFGERMSVKIFAELLEKNSLNSKSHISGDTGLITDSNFGDAKILEDSYEKMNLFFSKINYIPVVTGFGGKDEKGEYTTFQRGGSDYVAALIGTAVNAEEIQIWTDVNGVMTANPRIVENAKTIKSLSFAEASELAYFGAKVLHPKTIWPAIKKNIPVLVLNTFEPGSTGTLIVKECQEQTEIKAISYKKNITIIDASSTRMINAHGYLAKIFEVFSKYKRPIDMISTSEVDVSMTTDDNQNIDEIIKELNNFAYTVCHDKKSIIYVVGTKIQHNACLAGRILNCVGKSGIKVDMISQCYDGVSFGFVVEEEKSEFVVKLLHKELLE